MLLKHDLTSIRSFLKKMIMKIYTLNEIPLEKHLDNKNDRYTTITGNCFRFLSNYHQWLREGPKIRWC